MGPTTRRANRTTQDAPPKMAQAPSPRWSRHVTQAMQPGINCSRSNEMKRQGLVQAFHPISNSISVIGKQYLQQYDWDVCVKYIDIQSLPVD